MKGVNGQVVNTTGTNTDTDPVYSSSLRAAHSSTGWRLIPVFIAALVLIPVGTVVSSLFAPASDVWQHLVETTLADLLVNTFWLALGVSLGTGLLGVSLAWFTAVCDFPGCRFGGIRKKE